MKLLFWLPLSALLLTAGCSGSSGNKDNQGQLDGGIFSDQFFSVISASRQSLSPDGRPVVVLHVEINNKLASGLVVQASAIRVVTSDSSEEKAGDSIALGENECPVDPIILTPGGNIQCSLYFDLGVDEVPEKAALVTTSEGTERPAVREEAQIGSFEECDICGTTCMPAHVDRCGTCDTSCTAPPTVDAVCLGGTQERFSQATPSANTNHDYEEVPVACISWLAADTGDCANRCDDDGLVCVQGLGWNSRSSDPDQVETAVFGSHEERVEGDISYAGNCNLSVESNEFRVRMWCACHPGL